MSILPLPVRYRSAWLLSLLAAFCCVLPSARAVVYLSNINGTPGNGLFIAGSVTVAVGFQVNVTENNTWDFTIRVANDLAPGSVVRLQIYNDDGTGRPDDTTTPSSPFSIAFQSSSGTAADGRYTFRGSGTLSSANTYWLVASAQGGDEYAWPDTGAYTQSGATFFGTTVNDGVSGWGPSGTSTRLSLEIAPVPEPVHYSLFAALFLLACSLGKFCWNKRLAVARVRSQKSR